MWFGNEDETEIRNYTYGTSQAIEAFAAYGMGEELAARRGAEFLLSIQNADGGWGGAEGIASSPEETAFAVSALSLFADTNKPVLRGGLWLADSQHESGSWTATPIGLYFARLWYHERLYPAVYGLRALALAARTLREETLAPVLPGAIAP